MHNAALEMLDLLIGKKLFDLSEAAAPGWTLTSGSAPAGRLTPRLHEV